MPNRMFDPGSNPFAIQNLLEKRAPPFTALHDDRPAQEFGADPVLGTRIVPAFEVDSRLLAGDDDRATVPDTAFVPEQAASATAFASEPEAVTPTFRTAQPAGDASQGMRSSVTVQAEASTEPADDAAGAGVGTQSAETVSDMPIAAADHPGAGAADAALDATPPAAAADNSLVTDPLRDSEAVDQLLKAARAEAYAQGLEAGIAQGKEEERPLAHRDGYDDGFSAGLTQARTEMQAEREREKAQEAERQQAAEKKKLDQLQSLIAGLQQLSTDPDALFEPMKRLAVHLAEQLVRGELSQSPQAISRLVDNALRELNATGDKPVVLHLHPDDLELYRPTVAQFADSLVLRADHQLERGSVRASLDGSVVEDLIQRRMAGLKQSLSQPAAPGWRSAGGKLSERLADGERGSRQVEDVTPVVQDEHQFEAAPADGDA